MLMERQYSISQNHHINVISSENTLHLWKSFNILYINKYYHHLLPGLLLKINSKDSFSKSDETVIGLIDNKENFPLISKNNTQSFTTNILNSFNEFPLFIKCFQSFLISDIKPPQYLSLINYNISEYYYSLPKSEDSYNKNQSYITKKPKFNEKNMILPLKAISFIIGKDGKSIAMIRKQTNAFIKIHEFSNSETRFQSNLKGAKLQMLSIKGLKEDIEIAELLILKKIRIWNALQNDN
ncbi:hypothetical protein C6P42_000954 [Pichia californica]|nr:hypothetical protein C6P42_000954 [[Candida] californica]